MKLVIVCVRDVRAGFFANPIFVQSLGAAERQFADEVNRAAEDNLLYKHPEDFELYRLGTFDTEDATMELDTRPVQLCEGRSVMRKESPLQLRSVQ